MAQASAQASDAATRATDVHAGLKQDEAEAAAAARRMAEARIGLDALPASVKRTPAYKQLHGKVVQLERLLTAHADLLRVRASRASVLALRLTATSDLVRRTSAAEANVVAPAAQSASTKILALVPLANAMSANAAATAATLANATLSPRKRPAKAIHEQQVGGGAKLDKAVGKLDSAITNGADKTDNAYAYLAALNQRAADNKLPAGNAVGATAQAGAFVYSMSGANNTGHQTHVAVFIGGMALIIGIGFGISLYRIRRGMPSSMAPPKKSGAAASG
jgi:hypothetical protein